MRVYSVHQQVPEGLCLAFYKGNRDGYLGLYSRLGRRLDHGPYSHSEMIFSNGLSASASLEDKGVRFKHIRYSNPHRWDFLPIPDPDGDLEAYAYDWYTEHEGDKYDILGNIRFLIGFVRHSPDERFCSESNLEALKFPEPFRYGPSGAASIASFHFNSKIITGVRP